MQNLTFMSQTWRRVLKTILGTRAGRSNYRMQFTLNLRGKTSYGSRSFPPMSCSPRVVSPRLRVNSPRVWSHFAQRKRGVCVNIPHSKKSTHKHKTSIGVDSQSGWNDFILQAKWLLVWAKQLQVNRTLGERTIIPSYCSPLLLYTWSGHAWGCCLLSIIIIVCSKGTW